MLQQTQVATVIPYYERWMARFPTLDSLASSSEDEVLAMWQGLGYYRRAKFLRLGAQYLGSQSPPSFPSSHHLLLQVPGIGPYTAGAIASIAFGEAVPLVDGNVERVYARLIGDTSAGSDLKKAAWKWAGVHVYQDRPGDWNQALMELGAMICKPTDPRCCSCPVSGHCHAFQMGSQDQLPTAAPKTKTVHLTHHVWIPVCGERFGVRQIPAGLWWAGMWEFPRSAESVELERLVPGGCPNLVGSFRHSVTHHRIQVHVSVVRVEVEVAGLRWVSSGELAQLALPAPQRRALRMIEELG